MSQQSQHPHSDWPRTLHGFGHEADPPLIDAAGESKFVPVGAPVGQGGHVFETDRGLVVKLFTWAAEVPHAAVQDFTRAVMTVANLRHPHIAQVLDVGTLGDGTPFVVMERLAGMTLAEATSDRPLPITEVLPILHGVASALSAAHAAGVAHGEVRADNVFIAETRDRGRCAKLLDFGVAGLVAAASMPTRSRAELGSRAGERADQLALATLVWHLVRGQASPAVERLLLRAMSPDPSRRFGNVAAFIEALEEALVREAGASSRNEVGVKTIIGAAIREQPRRPVAVAAISRAVPAHAVNNAPTGIGGLPSSLTQQFFAEGDQLEIAHQQGEAETPVAAEGDDLDDMLAPRLPRSRAQMFWAAILAVGSVAVIGSTVVALTKKPISIAAPKAAEPSTRAPVARSAAIATPRAKVSVRPIERGPQRTTIAVIRASHVPAPPTAPPRQPEASPSAAPSATANASSPPPPVPAPPAQEAPAGADPAAADRATSGEATPAASNDVQAAGQSSHDEPTPSAPDDVGPAPAAPPAEGPPASNPGSPAP